MIIFSIIGNGVAESCLGAISCRSMKYYRGPYIQSRKRLILEH